VANRSKKDIVLNNLDKIKEWLSQGISVDSIAKSLGVSRPTIYKYANLDNIYTIKESREPAIKELENTMFNSACGFERKVKKFVKLKRCEYENGKKLREWEEMVEYEETVYYPPSDTAGIFLLKNWSDYMNEPQSLEIRKKELELKEKQVENNLW
jgi:transposase